MAGTLIFKFTDQLLTTTKQNNNDRFSGGNQLLNKRFLFTGQAYAFAFSSFAT